MITPLKSVYIVPNTNKKLYRAFDRHANQLLLNIPVLKGLLKVNSKAKKICAKLTNKIENNELQILKYQIKEIKRVVNQESVRA